MMNYYGKKEESIIKNRLKQLEERCLSVNNLGVLRGMVYDELEFSYSYMGVKYYKTRLEVIRPNIENRDYVPVIFSKKSIPDVLEKVKRGRYIEVYGEFRSHNKMGDDGKSHLELFLYAQEVNCYGEFIEESANELYLRGFVCKNVIYRETPKETKIADIILAVNRAKYKKTDYIPCIAWWRNAIKASYYEIGQEVEIFGRIQSRLVPKKQENSEERIWKDVYEISIASLKEVDSSSDI